ncbi:hypothetical protein [Pseudoxanthomonas composti]|uniref:Uncharacterized protein n=1 Tax=Pseudoxanthomonas composti TaxID=2137479 RepID=A0A4Q1JXE8_9GAMM|nr:hypothetical protein [Pseudoxanthomonas composti]RXR07305.1 hypothetical protein EPA99_05145 [Pseudoxanthomonas composti]
MRIFCSRTKRWEWVAATVALTFGNAHVDVRPCSIQEAFAAEQEASSVRHWEAVYQSYERFFHCDDGAIREGYSYSVGSLLANQWEEFDELVLLTRGSPRFEDFVVSHIDETLPQNDARKIQENLSRCPKSGKKLCSRLKRAITSLRE